MSYARAACVIAFGVLGCGGQSAPIMATVAVVASCGETFPTTALQTPPHKTGRQYTSEWGVVHRIDSTNGKWVGAYPRGILDCTETGEGGETSLCEWHEGGSNGRATFARTAEGKLSGTWGFGDETEGGGEWTLVPMVRGSGLSGAWETNWGSATITLEGQRAHIVSARGTMDCDTSRKPNLTCDWTEGSAVGKAELVVDSDRVIRGHWGSGPSSTDGGEWIFVRPDG